MKLIIAQPDLNRLLQAVSRSCGVRSQLPVLANVLIQASGGRIKLSATNLEIGVLKSTTAEVAEEGEITVPARTLVEVIANLPSVPVALESHSDQLMVSTNSFTASLNGISAAEFPSIPLAGKDAVSVPPQSLLKSLPEVTFAAAVDEGRPVLTGILTEINKGKLSLVATDGYRLAHKSTPVEESVDFKALIPRKTFEEVLRLVSEEEADRVQIATSDNQNQMVFTFGNTQLSSRLIEGQFPAWEKIIPQDIKARVVVERGELLKAVKLAAIFVKSEANVVKIQNLADKLVLVSEAKELGSQKSEVEASSEGEELNVAFNTKFLTDALSAFNTSQAVLELSGALSAAIIKPVGEEGLMYIVMPVNLG